VAVEQLRGMRVIAGERNDRFSPFARLDLRNGDPAHLTLYRHERLPFLLNVVRGITRAVGTIEADRIGKAQCRRTEIVVPAGKVNSTDQIKPSAIVENVRGQTRAGWAIHAADLLEPGDSALNLSRLAFPSPFAAGDRQEPSEDGVTAGLNARDRLPAQIAEQREIIFGLTQQGRTLLLAVQEIDHGCDKNRVLFFHRIDTGGGSVRHEYRAVVRAGHHGI